MKTTLLFLSLFLTTTILSQVVFVDNFDGVYTAPTPPPSQYIQHPFDINNDGELDIKKKNLLNEFFLQIYIGDKYGHYILRDMAVGERRGTANGGMSINTWSYYVPYLTYETDDPARPYKVWVFNGSNTNILVEENWYN